MDFVVGLSLRAVLLELIYPMDSALLRNDSRTAKLLFDYVAKVSKQIEAGVDTEDLSLLAAKTLWSQMAPLDGLSQQTLRKYISEIWSDDCYTGIKRYVRLEPDADTKLDVREYDRWDRYNSR